MAPIMFPPPLPDVVFAAPLSPRPPARRVAERSPTPGHLPRSPSRESTPRDREPRVQFMDEQADGRPADSRRDRPPLADDRGHRFGTKGKEKNRKGEKGRGKGKAAGKKGKKGKGRSKDWTGEQKW